MCRIISETVQDSHTVTNNNQHTVYQIALLADDLWWSLMITSATENISEANVVKYTVYVTYGAAWRFWLLRLINTLTYLFTYLRLKYQRQEVK